MVPPLGEPSLAIIVREERIVPKAAGMHGTPILVRYISAQLLSAASSLMTSASVYMDICIYVCVYVVI